MKRPRAPFASLALCLLVPVGVACSEDVVRPGDTLTWDAVDTANPFDTSADVAPDTSLDADDTSQADADDADDTPPEDTAEAADTYVDSTDTGPTDTNDTDDANDANDSEDAPTTVTVSRAHWRVVFEDDFRGPQGKDSDDYCFDALLPQCHVWPGGSYHCDQSDVQGEGFYPPLRPNLMQALSLFMSTADLAALGTDELRALYGQLIRERLADLDKCTWTLYSMVNWMATDYQGHWSARFDATQVKVDASGKGTLELAATYAPLEANCIFGGAGGNPNCQIHGFAAGVLVPGVTYWVDPNPAWAGVYYAPTGTTCPHGGTYTGVNCTVYAFPPNVLEARDVTYWADPDPRWPGVYYANRQYACRDNIDYAPALGFRNLTCPILNGAVMSYVMENRPYVGPDGNVARGYEQRRGRFEAKARIPKGIGAFPAAWLMPKTGGWPYDGGEIDVMEARDNADEIYQTYHHGRCYNPSTGVEIDATDAGDCDRKGGRTTHLSQGFTTVDRDPDEFWKRDHLFAVEWTETPSGDRFDYYLNNVRIGTIQPGTVGRIDEGAPSHLATFAASNFPTSPFYWILNHSTWVPADRQASFVQQLFRIDYVRNYAMCGSDPAEYCPTGGIFREGVGCERAGRVHPSPCEPAKRECVNGGEAVGARCRVWQLAPGELVSAADYWVDADPRWPGLFYHKVDGGCPHGGSGEINCQLLAFPADLLETGIAYSVDKLANAIFYTPDFRQ